MSAFNRGRPLAGRQRGVGLLGALLLLLVAASLAVVALRLAPVYLEAWTVRSVVNSLASDHSLRGASQQQLRQALQRRLDVNNVTRLQRDDVRFGTASGGTELVVAYEVRVPLFGNLDAVASFRFQTVIPQ